MTQKNSFGSWPLFLLTLTVEGPLLDSSFVSLALLHCSVFSENKTAVLWRTGCEIQKVRLESAVGKDYTSRQRHPRLAPRLRANAMGEAKRLVSIGFIWSWEGHRGTMTSHKSKENSEI